VNTPEIGSRDGGNCLGEFWGVYADLRREFCWGNLKWGIFWGLGVSPREAIEEGGPFKCFPSVWRNFLVFWGWSTPLGCAWGDLFT
jgi:hypothetical protein